jgi:hypothetical protein
MKELLVDTEHHQATFVPPLEQQSSEMGEEVVEVPLLLPGWQISALEKEAHDRGLTAGEMVRVVLRDFITLRKEAGSERSLSSTIR